jgi:glycosyltransferase involved in cell wall biosynthesis
MSLISVIIPVYNSEKTISQCLDSIFSQTFKDFEVIVVNDGSTDKSLSLLRGYGSKIKLISQENKGAPVARNIGFEKSTGEYVIFFDSDIVAKPYMLEKMYNLLSPKKSIAYVYSSFKFGFKVFKLMPFNPEKLKKMPYIHTTSLLRRKYFVPFDESLTRFQDWDLWLSILESGGQGLWINEVLFKIKSGGTISSWLPRFMYSLPWLKKVREYRRSKKIIMAKHKLN